MLNVDQLADEVRNHSRVERCKDRQYMRRGMLAGKTRDQQLQVIVWHIRARCEYSPREWYR